MDNIIPAPYSYDLRSKAIEAVKRGEKKTLVSRLFKISRNTLNLWLIELLGNKVK